MKKIFNCRECNPKNPKHMGECYLAAVADLEEYECIGGIDRRLISIPWAFRMN